MSSVGSLEVPSSFPPITSLSASTLDLPQKVAGNINRERSPSASGRPRASSLEPGSLYQCSECKYMTNSKQRYDKHFKQPRHVNFYRDRAYKGKTNMFLRAPESKDFFNFWLTYWFSVKANFCPEWKVGIIKWDWHFAMTSPSVFSDGAWGGSQLDFLKKIIQILLKLFYRA